MQCSLRTNTVLVRDCDSMYANRFRNYIYGIPLDLVRQRSYIISLNDVGGGSDISDVKYMSDHAYIFSNLIPKKKYGIYLRRRPQFVMAKGHNIPKSHTSLFVVGGRHSCLWAEATRINESKIPITAGIDCL